MRTIKVLSMLFAAALLTAACSKDKGADIDPNAPVAVKFRSGIEVETKAKNDAWTLNDKVGIFMLKTGQPLASGNIAESADNRQYKVKTAATGEFEPDAANQTIYYPVAGTAVDFIAYYPYKASLTAYKYPVSTKTADQANQEAIDLMYSQNVTNKSKTDVNVNLGFKHKLSKVEFNITAGAGITTAQLSGIIITMKNLNTTAEFNLADSTLNNVATPLDVSPLTKGDGTYAEAVMIPQNGSGQDFEFKIGNDVFKWSNNKNFEAGKKYTYNVRIDRTEAVVTGTIKDWEGVGPVTVIAN